MPIPTGLPLMTSTPPRADPLIQECLVEVDMSTAPRMGGVIAIESVKPDEDDYLLELSTNTRTSLGRVVGLETSLDGRLLAVSDVEAPTIRIVDAGGHERAAISSEGDVLHPAYWLGEDELALNKEVPIGQGDLFRLEQVVLNLRTSETRTFAGEFPGIFEIQAEVGWASSFILSPSTAYAVYPVIEAGDTAQILWDIGAAREVAMIRRRWDWGETPWWLPDSTAFITSGEPEWMGASTEQDEPEGFELFRISTDGAVAPLTNLNSMHRTEDFAGFFGAPDARSMATWLALAEATGARQVLAIVELQSGRVTEYCVTPGDQSSEIVWSPSGDGLAFTRVLGTRYDAYVADLASGKFWQVAEQGWIAGWMMSGY
jgi:hypothetical protein